MRSTDHCFLNAADKTITQNKNTIRPDYQKFDSKILFYKNVFAS
jgi:hypothetical protein